MASLGGHLDVVRLLLKNNADANLADQVPPPAFSKHISCKLTQHAQPSRQHCQTADDALPNAAVWRSATADDADFYGAEASHQHGCRV